MIDNECINKFTMKMSGKVSDDELKTIVTELQILLDNYDINPKSTELAIYEDNYQEIRQFLIAKKLEGRSPNTLKLYSLCLRHAMDKIHKPVKDITGNDLRCYLYQLQIDRNITNRTLDNRRLILNTFFQWLTQEGYIEKNPCKIITPIKYEAKPREPFTDIEMEILRDACVTERERAIIETLYSTGCRVSELMILKKSDIDFVTREVHLFGKGQKHRISYLNARAELYLEKYFKKRRDSDEHVFVSDRWPHKGLSKEGIEKIIRIIGKRAGIEHVYPHRFRHTMATDALGHGMPVTDLQSILGHSRLETTMIYAKMSQENILHNHKKCII